MKNPIIIILVLLCQQVQCQNISQYFDDGISNDLELYVSFNAAQVLTGHYGVEVEKKIGNKFSLAAEYGMVNANFNKYALEYMDDAPTNSLYYKNQGGSFYAITAFWGYHINDEAFQTGLRFKNYAIVTQDDQNLNARQYDILQTFRILYRGHIFLKVYTGFGFRYGEEIGMDPYTQLTTKQPAYLGTHLPSGICLGLYF